MSGRSLIIAGATGMIGGLALRLALKDPVVGSITVIGRRPTGLKDPTLREVLHDDYIDYSSIADSFADHDAALFCLGAYTGAVSDDEFRRITVDFTIAFARTLFMGSPNAAFCLLSGQGADHTEQSRLAFARYKGAAEKALLAIGFPRVHIFRPGYIYPVEPRTEPNLSYRAMRRLYPILSAIHPNIGIASDDLAAAMLHAGLHGTGAQTCPVLENRAIRTMAKRLSAERSV